MTQQDVPKTNGKLSVIASMAEKFGMEAPAFEATLRATIFPPKGTREEFAAFLLVCSNYSLNPLTKEIYAFPKQGGGIVPVVSIDGWMNMINSHAAFDGMEFSEQHEQGELVSTTCIIYRKDRAYPTSVTEYLVECRRPTDPWKMKHRMLRHKAVIQCSRYAFGFAGIYDEDEGMKIAMSEASKQTRSLPLPRITSNRTATVGSGGASQAGWVAPSSWRPPEMKELTADEDAVHAHDPNTGEIIKGEEIWDEISNEEGDDVKDAPKAGATETLVKEGRRVAKDGGSEILKEWLDRLNAPDFNRISGYVDDLIDEARKADIHAPADPPKIKLSEAAKKTLK